MDTKEVNLSSLRIDRNKKNTNPEQKSKITRTISIVVLVVVIVLVVKFGWEYLFTPATEVKMVPAILQNPAQTNALLTANGYVVAQRKAAVASKGTGRLVYLGVVEGDAVKKDQIIARIEDSDILAMLDQAKANLKLNEAELFQVTNNLKRQKDLLDKKLSSPREYEAAEAAYKRVLALIDVAKAQVTAAEVSLENTRIRAPFSGTVLTKNAEVGEIVAPMAASVTSRGAVVTMADMNSLQVEADVSESNIEKIKLNQNCEIILDAYPERSYPGYVAKIVPTADRAKATVLVKIGFKDYDSRVLPEMSARVALLTEELKSSERDQKPMLIIPKTAVKFINGESFVYKVKDDLAVEVKIKTGKEAGSYVEVLDGILSGDRIIETINEKIINGIKVKIQ